MDYCPVKTEGPYKLHYHVPPNMKKHHIIFKGGLPLDCDDAQHLHI
ncbi:hypothetical protein CHCC20348_2708 [Bacillus paralicheniformis]|nr:hypothetical protein CHCC20348_2708 [Bacillus paralicheniformis]